MWTAHSPVQDAVVHLNDKYRRSFVCTQFFEEDGLKDTKLQSEWLADGIFFCIFALERTTNVILTENEDKAITTFSITGAGIGN